MKLGTWVSTASPIIGELMADAGFDFICVDCEHSPASYMDVQNISAAVDSIDPSCATWVRVPGVDYASVKRYLDTGARGIIAPLVNTREQAEELVDACKYPPLGRRGVGYCRASRYGKTVEPYTRFANDHVFVAAQIEHIDAIPNLDDILSVEGIDCAFIGPYDLAASMGHLGRPEHPDAERAMSSIIDACERWGVAAGIHCVQPDPARVVAAKERGFSVIAYSLDITMLSKSAHDAVSALK